jgi:hypothetical protein
MVELNFYFPIYLHGVVSGADGEIGSLKWNRMGQLKLFCSDNKMVFDLLCGLVGRVLGYRSGGPGSISGTTRKKVVGLERGPLSLVSTN